MTQKKSNDPATLRCDNEPCLFHHLGICRFSCHKWEPCANTGARARIDAVVKELERLKEEALEEHEPAFNVVASAYASAIALLKEGVGK